MTTRPRFPRPPFGVTLAAIALALLALPAFAAADPEPTPTYEADVTVSTTESFTFAGKAAPDPCRSWTQALGSVSVDAHAVGPFLLFKGRGGNYGRLRGSKAKREAKVTQELRYRRHTGAFTAECSPCGSGSEYGECDPEKPDETGDVNCDRPVNGSRISMLLVAGKLAVWGLVPSGPALRDCAHGVPSGIPLGSAEPELEGITFSSGVGRIAKLAVGESADFKRTVRRGEGCKPRKGQELEVCIRDTVEAVIRRVG
jgi:hypothetical protein